MSESHDLPAVDRITVGAVGPPGQRLFLLQAEELTPEDEDDVLAGVARFGTTREQVAALAIRGTQLVEAGRPSCPLCGYPLDPSGHACPRTNGHRPPTL